MRTIRGIMKPVHTRKGRIGRAWLRRSRARRSYRDRRVRSRMSRRMPRPGCGKTQSNFRSATCVM